MKNLIALACVLFISFSFLGQVGINTTNPQASLDIPASSVSAPSNTDGILIPRMDDFPNTNPTSAQDGMLVFITGNGTPSKGFYYWDEGSSSWSNVQGTDDEDWLSTATGSPPTGNSENIYRNGFLGIGTNTTSAPITLENNTLTSSMIFSEGVTATTNGVYYFLNSDITHNAGTLRHLELTSTGTNSANFATGIYNSLTYNGTSIYTGISNEISGTGTGLKNGIINSFPVSAGGDLSGVKNNFFSSLATSKTGFHNVFSSINGESVGLDNEFDTASGATMIGTRNIFNGPLVSNTSMTGIRTEFNSVSSNTGSRTGQRIIFRENGSATNLNDRGNSISFIGTFNGYTAGSTHDLNTSSFVSSSTRRGVSNWLRGNYSGTSYGVFNLVDGISNNDQYGSYNNVRGIAGGSRYGTYNLLNGDGTGVQYGTYSRIDTETAVAANGFYCFLNGGGSVDRTGINNNINTTGGIGVGTFTTLTGAGTGNQYGTRHRIDYGGSGTIYGTYNFFEGANTGNQYGNYALIEGTGFGNKYGYYVDIPSSTGGDHYGVYADVLGSDNYAAYFLGRVSIGTNTTNNYLLPLSRGLNSQTLTTDTNGNVSWQNNVSNANNGLSATAGTVQLGGSLNQNTTVALANNNLVFDANSIGNFIIQDNGTNHFEVRNNGNSLFGGDVLFYDEDTTGPILASLTDIGDSGLFALYNGGSLQHFISSNGNVFFNDLGLNTNFIIESIGQPFMFTLRGDTNRIGVRTGTPTHDLTIKQSTSSQNGAGGLAFESVGSSDNWKIYHSGLHLSFAENGIRRAYVEGGSGNYVITSDRRLKKNITPMENTLERLMNTKTYQYDYINQNSNKKNVGFMAQEVIELFPDAVRLNEDGYYGINYDYFTVVAVKGIQEQQKEINTLKNEIEELKRMVTKLSTKQ